MSIFLQADQFFSRNGIPHRLYAPTHALSMTGNLDIRHIRNLNDVSGATHVAYWGDLTTSSAYGADNFSRGRVQSGQVAT